MSAPQANEALKTLPVDDLDLTLIGSAGNVVCPSAFSLGESGKIVVLSAAESDDKSAKYPGIFAKSKVLLLNKIGLLADGYVQFDTERKLMPAA